VARSQHHGRPPFAERLLRRGPGKKLHFTFEDVNFSLATGGINAERSPAIHDVDLGGFQAEATRWRRHLGQQPSGGTNGLRLGNELQFRRPFHHHPRTAIKDHLRQAGLEPKPARFQGTAHPQRLRALAPTGVHGAG